MPLTTNENNPNVIKVSGSDYRLITGRTSVLTTAMDSAAIKAAGNVAISTSGITKSTTRRLKAVIKPDNKDVSILTFFSSIVYLQRHSCKFTKIPTPH